MKILLVNVALVLATLYRTHAVTIEKEELRQQLINQVATYMETGESLQYNTDIQSFVDVVAEGCGATKQATFQENEGNSALIFIFPAVVVLQNLSSLDAAFLEALPTTDKNWFQNQGEPFAGLSWNIFDTGRKGRQVKYVQFVIGIYRYSPQEQYPSAMLPALWQQALNVHNYYRKLHGVQFLTLDANLTNAAQAYAQDLASRDSEDHSPEAQNFMYGENLGGGSDISVRQQDIYAADFVVDAWYDEIEYYTNYNDNFPPESELDKFGHFTALVWAATSRVGFGIYYGPRTNPSGLKVYGIWFVANYLSQGNVPNQFIKNVLKPKGKNMRKSEA